MPDRNTNLGTGPWQTLKRGRREEWDRKNNLFWKFYRGWLAAEAGETIFAPPAWTDEERAQYRDGWEKRKRRTDETPPEEDA